ncbi:MAG TPA: SDR family NAD(P)-dependent oxidoreductase [Candidatus Kapabacteria bacterium]|nr:SDR family oxidoreductase [Ignavibacteria bacterium]HRE56531.1 SDR family NAD(P)-dependent oxidoreductase [Candidatus Kapabacteria bacterium]
MDKQWVLITGSAKRLGRACALRYAEKGYSIILHFHMSEERAHQTANELRQMGTDVIVVKGNLTKESDCVQIFEKLEALQCIPRIIVNNAGVFPEKLMLKDMESTYWDETYNINLRSQLLVSREFVRLVERTRAKGDFRIILISSLGGRETWKYRTAYNVSKSGVIQLAKSLASELAPKFTVNCICPGAISQPDDFSEQDSGLIPIHRIPMERYGNADDIFDAIYFFSTCSPYITGQILTVDGGYHLSRT